MTEFHCDKCGECCRHIDLIPQLSHFDSGDGSCIYLIGNMCSIYDKRPDICRVDVMFDKVYYKYYSRDEYNAVNMKACEEIKSHKIFENDKRKT